MIKDILWASLDILLQVYLSAESAWLALRKRFSKFCFRVRTWRGLPEEPEHPVDQYAPPVRKKPTLIKRK